MENPAGLTTYHCTEKELHPPRPCTNCARKLLQLSLWTAKHSLTPLTSAHG